MTAVKEHLDAFRKALSERGLKLTSQRRAIAQVFFAEHEQHLSLTDILERARELRPRVGYATVYRTMRLLTDVGLAVEHKFGENQARYEPAHDGEHHDHLICVECGLIVEFEDHEIERRQDRRAKEEGFEVVSHRHEVYVRCLPERCRRDEAPERG